jgi:hypothetical protein
MDEDLDGLVEALDGTVPWDVDLDRNRNYIAVAIGREVGRMRGGCGIDDWEAAPHRFLLGR